MALENPMTRRRDSKHRVLRSGESISVIRLPDFVTKADFDWAVEEATRKKKMDFSKVEYFTYDEGLCVQCLHIGPYDDEPNTVERMHQYMEEQGYTLDISDQRSPA